MVKELEVEKELVIKSLKESKGNMKFAEKLIIKTKFKKYLEDNPQSSIAYETALREKDLVSINLGLFLRVKSLFFLALSSQNDYGIIRFTEIESRNIHQSA